MSKTVLLLDNATKLIVPEPNPPGDLTAIEELQGQGFTFHSTAHAWACRAFQGSTGVAILNNDGASGDPIFGLTGPALEVASITSTGLMSRGSTGAWVGRQIVGTPNQITVVNPAGLTGNPTLSLPQDIGTGSTPQFAGIGLSSIPNALLKTSSGGVTAAVAKTDYAPATIGSTILKGDGAGGFTGAVATTDYAPPTFTGATGVLLKNDLAGGFTGAVSGTDFAPATFTGTTAVLLKNNLAGGFTAATPGVDYVPTGGTAANAANAAKITTSSDNSTNAPFYPTFVSATGVNQDPKVSDGANPVTWNPGAGVFFAPILQGRSVQVYGVTGAELIGVTGNRDFSTAGNWTGANWVRPTTGTVVTISVTANNTFHRSSGSFITDGFQVGMSFISAGFVSGSNNGTFTIATITATDITVTITTLVVVGAGASVSFTSSSWSHNTGTSTPTNLPSAQMGGTPNSGDVFSVALTVYTSVTGAVTPSIGGGNGIILGGVTGTTTQTIEITSAGNADLTLTPDANWGGFLTAVSAKSITRGSFKLNSLSLTTGSMNMVRTGDIRAAHSKYQWTTAMVTGLGALTTGNLKVCTLPPRTYVKAAWLVIDSPGGTVTTLTASLGRTGAVYNDYILAGDAKAAANTVYGDVSGERGTNMTGYDLPSFISPTDIYVQFISTGGNLSTVTGSTGTVFLETVTL